MTQVLARRARRADFIRTVLGTGYGLREGSESWKPHRDG